jgi:hypothetical protein
MDVDPELKLLNRQIQITTGEELSSEGSVHENSLANFDLNRSVQMDYYQNPLDVTINTHRTQRSPIK